MVDYSYRDAFARTHPQIAEMHVEVVEHATRPTTQDFRYVYTHDDPPAPRIECSNPMCRRGGFPLDRMIRKMVQSWQTHSEQRTVCQGREGSPQLRRDYGSCFHTFEVTVDLLYK